MRLCRVLFELDAYLLCAHLDRLGRMFAQRVWFLRDLAHDKALTIWKRERKAESCARRRATLLYRLGHRVDGVPHVVTFFSHPSGDQTLMEVYEPQTCTVWNFKVSATQVKCCTASVHMSCSSTLTRNAACPSAPRCGFTRAQRSPTTSLRVLPTMSPLLGFTGTCSARSKDYISQPSPATHWWGSAAPAQVYGSWRTASHDHIMAQPTRVWNACASEGTSTSRPIARRLHLQARCHLGRQGSQQCST